MGHFYLSRLKLNRNANHNLIRHCLCTSTSRGKRASARQHLIWKVFNSRREQEKRRFIFSECGSGKFLVISETIPNEMPLVSIQSVDRISSEDFPDGKEFGFSLKFNAQKKKNGKSVDVVIEALNSARETGNPITTVRAADEEVRAWMDRAAQRSGFSIETMTVDHYSPFRTENINRNRKHHEQYISEAAVSGILKVIDSMIFFYALTHGIGRNGNYGYGMMILDEKF